MEEGGADHSMTPRGGPMQTCAFTCVPQLNQSPCMAKHHHYLCVSSLARSEERGVAIGIDSIQVCRMLEEELDTSGMAREGGSMQCCRCE